MADRIQITAQRKVLREIAVLVEAAHLGQQDPHTQEAVFMAHEHMLRDRYRRNELVRAALSPQDHAAALSVAQKHQNRFPMAHLSLMNASPTTV